MLGIGNKSNMKTTKLTVTIGIPAHNEAQRIGKLLRAIQLQKKNTFELIEIIVYDDASSDQTFNECQKLQDPLISCITGKQRVGQMQGIATILRKSAGDVVVLLDADIQFRDHDTVEKLVEPFYTNQHVGLVGGNPLPTKAKTFIEQAIHTSIYSYRNIALHLRGGSNPYNCHGCVVALSKTFAKSLTIPKDIFSGDTYMYFSCIHSGFYFTYSPDAIVWYKTPNNLRDAIKQYTRFLDIDQYSKQKFGNLLRTEYEVPTLLRYKYIALELIKHPLESVFMFFLMKYCQNSKPKDTKNGIWDIAESTKGKTHEEK